MIELCTFLLGGRRFGVPAADVREVVRFAPPTPVPLAPAWVAGVADVRGEILAAIDVAARLGLPAASPRFAVLAHSLSRGTGTP